MHPTTTPLLLSYTDLLCSPLRPWCRLMALHRSAAVVLLLVLIMGSVVTAQQTLIQQATLRLERTRPSLTLTSWSGSLSRPKVSRQGPELAVLRGDAKGGAPCNGPPAGQLYVSQPQSHERRTVRLAGGNFTYIAADGTATPQRAKL